jgi:hypothetical protein
MYPWVSQVTFSVQVSLPDCVGQWQKPYKEAASGERVHDAALYRSATPDLPIRIRQIYICISYIFCACYLTLPIFFSMNKIERYKNILFFNVGKILCKLNSLTREIAIPWFERLVRKVIQVCEVVVCVNDGQICAAPWNFSVKRKRHL